jgi:KaiC/GvpD/RAD55 family RecA-like ATPase
MAAGSRTMLYGPTGKGKTMTCMAIAMAIAAGQDFVHWQGSQRPRKVVYVDGDMSYDDMRLRVRQEYARMGSGDISGFKLLSHEKVKLPKLDTAEGQRVVDDFVEKNGADLIVFDNLQSLLSDVGKEAWARVLDWTKELTARGIGQLWQHHTGHDERHAYGDKSREWGLDTVIHLRTHKAEPSELIVSLAFEKVRGIRTVDHDTVQLQLIGNRWSSSGGTKPAANRVAMIEALLEDAGKRISEPELAELINPNDVDGEKRRLQGNHREKAYNHLCAKDGARWFWSSQDLNQD